MQNEDQRSVAFESIMKQIEAYPQYDEIVEVGIKNFESLRLENLNPKKIRRMHMLILQRHKSGKQSEDNLAEFWLENEKKLFIWLFLSYRHVVMQETAQDLSNEHFHLLAISLAKNIDLVKFEAATLFNSNHRRNWDPEEDQFLTQIITQREGEVKGDWLPISKGLYVKSQYRFLRTSKQCRERWLNHLDPSKSKGKWSSQQDLILLRGVRKNGKRWAQISAELKGAKNEHMVKNRFNSLINRVKKGTRIKDEKEIILILLDQIKEKTIEQAKFDLKSIEKTQERFSQRPNEEFALVQSTRYKPEKDFFQEECAENGSLRQGQEENLEDKECSFQGSNFMKFISQCRSPDYKCLPTPVVPSPMPFGRGSSTTDCVNGGSNFGEGMKNRFEQFTSLTSLFKSQNSFK